MNFYKSFIIKNEADEEAFSDEGESQKTDEHVDHKEQTFKEIKGLYGTQTKLYTNAIHNTTVSDVLYVLLMNVAEENPD
jgi:hypothetical protein